jgi:hypothetical protein
MSLFDTTKTSAEVLFDKLEHFYDEHEAAVNLSLLGILGTATAGVGLKALLSGVEETVAQAGTKEFVALQDSARFAVEADDCPLRFFQGIDGVDSQYFAAPSTASGASTWRVTIPPSLESSEPLFNGAGHNTAVLEKYGDVRITKTADAMEIERPSWGSVILREDSATGRVYGPNGQLRLVLNPLGDEIRYGLDGRITSIGRNVRRTLDLRSPFPLD